MSTVDRARLALIEAIRQTPGADGPRLDAARWFEAQGDPASVARAEFIRVQLERASAPHREDAQCALAARELRLLRQWAPAWASAHPALTKVIYRRGFAEFVHIHARKFLPWRKQLFAIEPVRDVRITGLYRPRADIIEAVARCEEWKRVESLRFHHQGPHHEPRELLLTLLESPHLRSLRALHGTRFQLSAEGRRRFERLALIEQIETLVMPSLDWFPEDPGPWFSDGAPSAARWNNLRDFTDYGSGTRSSDLRWWDFAFWNNLDTLSISSTDELMDTLAERLPPRLHALRFYNGSYSYNDPGRDDAYDGLMAALATRPLRSLDLQLSGSSALSLPFCRALREGRWALDNLSLPTLDGDMVEGLARSPGARHLRKLAAQGATEGALEELTACEGLALESLELRAEKELPNELLVRLLSSPVARSAACLSLACTRLDHAVADALCAMPNLEHLALNAQSCDPSARARLEAHVGTTGWLVIESNDEPWPEDEAGQRAVLRQMRAAGSAERVIPLDGYVSRM